MNRQDQAQLDAEAWAIVERVATPLSDITNWACHYGVCDPSECSRCKHILVARQLLARRKRLQYPPQAEAIPASEPRTAAQTERQSDR